MKKNFRKLLYFAIVIALVWTALTLWAEYSGGKEVLFVGDAAAANKALVVYNPDPIYNLDERVCRSFAEGLAPQGYYVRIATVKAAAEDTGRYDCFAFCANTYNWAPDRSVRKYIAAHPHLENSRVVAITLGSGSTARAQRLLEETIRAKNADLVRSEAFWLLKPNDESRMEENNVAVAVDKARRLGESVGNAPR